MAAAAPLDYRDPEWVAKQLGIDKNAVYRYLDEGRKWLISEATLAEFLRREEQEQTERRRAGAMPRGKFMRRLRKLPITERTERVLTLAHEEAMTRGHNHVGQEHILLAFAREPECVAAKILSNLGIDVRSALEPLVGHGEGPATGDIDFTPHARKALELAIDEARRLRHHYIGTEHLLVGIARAGDLALLEESQGVTLERLRVEMKRILAQRPAGT